ncbi:hypothetical protein S245_065606 [Arachis hypogaea]|uniref:Uncharacterized protein n=1 Tax=Arachis hypogaea TaxID=3818 RepID=A0A6B9V5J9_ARAHY|nr:uncharacterized protein DS421_19g641630 [Arachis hypogaea]
MERSWAKLSQNCNLDKTLELLSGIFCIFLGFNIFRSILLSHLVYFHLNTGMTTLRSLNVSNTRASNGNATVSSSSPRVLRIGVLFTLNFVIGRSVKATATFWAQ